MKSVIKRYVALVLALLMIVTSDSSVVSVWAGEPNTDPAAVSEGGGEPTPGPTQTPQQEPAQTPIQEPSEAPAQEPTAEPSKEPSKEPAAEPTQEPSAAPDSTQDAAGGPSNEPEQMPAPLSDEPAVINFDMGATVTPGELSAGDQFTYEIGYNLTALPEGQSYQSLSMNVDLTAYKDYLYVDSAKDITVIGADVEGVVLRNGQLIVQFPRSSVTGVAKTMKVVLKTRNFASPNGTVITLDPRIQGQADGKDVVGSIAEAKRPAVTIKANDGWDVKKSSAGVTSDENNYYASYQITLQNQWKNNSGVWEDQDWARYGRLDFAKDGSGRELFSLTDILPVNTPANGGAAAVSVTMRDNNPNSGQSSLTEGSDYIVQKNDNGEITSIELKKYVKSTQADVAANQMAAADKAKTTVYTVTVTYPKAAYVIPSNEDFDFYELENTAKLKYTLLGQPEDNREAKAVIQLGEKETDPVKADIRVKKVWSVDGQEYAYGDLTVDGQVTFGLFQDKECTKRAANWNKTVTFDTLTAVDENGEAVFKDVRYGTYYLKETTVPEGYKPAEVIPVTIKNDGSIVLGEGVTLAAAEGVVKVTNTATDVGIVRFRKVGVNSEGETENLKGVEFTLTRQGETEPAVAAVSDENGLVLFPALLEGTYLLRETKVSDGDYEVPEKEYTVTVSGGKITDLSSAEGFAPGTDGTAVFTNTSPKGKFRIKKISTEKKNGAEVPLEGARFAVYGLKQGSTAADLKEEDLVTKADGTPYVLTTDENGVGLSIALKEGTYFVKEVEAPEGYQLSAEVKTIEVEKNRITEVEAAFTNEPKIPVIFSKKGILGQNDGESDYKENLAGAVFSVWSSADTGDEGNLVGYVKTYLDQTGISVSGIAGKKGESYEPIKDIEGKYQNMILSAGTYYYKEEAAPEGFDLDPQVYEFSLAQGDAAKTIEVLDTTAYGQIEIHKTDAAGSPLTGAEFTIYNKDTCRDQDVVQKLTLGEKSSAVSKLLPAGTYYVKETKAPEGYVKSGEITPVTVTDKAKVSVTLENKRKASLKLTKVDSVQSTKNLEGASFGLYVKAGENSYLPAADIDGNVISEKTTGTDGVVRFDNLEPGKEYYYHETKAPQGYVPDPEYYPVTIPGDRGGSDPAEAAVTVENSRKAKLVIEKTGAYDGQNVNLSGVTFQVYKADTENDTFNLTDCSLAGTVVTDNEGKARLDDLEPGTYWLVEQAYAGYETLAPQKVNLTAGMNQAGYPEKITALENVPSQGRIQIEKVSAADSSTKLSAEFTIFGSKEEGGQFVADTEKTYGILMTDDSGAALSDLLDPGTYFLKETKAPGGYVMDEVYHPVTVEAGKTNKAYTEAMAMKNTPKRKVVIQKYAQFQLAGDAGTVEYELAGMQFSIYKATGDGEENQKKDLTPENLVFENVSMDTYQKELQLAPDKYWFVEDKETAEAAHYHQKILYFEVKAAETGTEVDTEISVKVDNTSSRGLIRVFKEDADTLTRLQGAEFELYREKAGAASGGSYEADKDNLELVRASGSFGTDADKMVTVGNDGTAYTTPLEPGTYYLKETKAPDGYNILTEWTGPITVTAGTESQVTVKNKKQVDAEGTKQGQGETGAPTGLEGAGIAAFASKEDAAVVRDFLNSEGAVFPTNAQVKTADAFNQYLAQKGISVKAAAVAVSGANGIFQFQNLSANTEYWLLEVKVPEKKGQEEYEWNPEIFQVKTNPDGGFATAPAIINKKKGWIVASKKTELDGTQIVVPNVHFHVYEAEKASDGTYTDQEGNNYKKGALVAAGYTGPKGNYTSIPLTPERYYVVEEVAPGEKDTCGKPSSNQAPDYIEYDAPGQLVYVPVGTFTSNVVFENTVKNGKISFTKIDAQTGAKLAAVFKVQKLDDNGNYVDYKKKNEVYKITTSSTGITVSDWLEPGTYQLVEESAGTGDNYTLITLSGIEVRPGKTTTVTSGDTSGTVANNQKGSFVLKKQGWWKNHTENTEELAADKLNGVEFKIYKKTGDQIADDVKPDTDPVAAAATQNGSITVKLDAGDYWFVETSLGSNSSGYESLGDFDSQLTAAQTNHQYFTIKPGKTFTWKDTDDQPFMKNYATGGRIQIKKTDVNTNQPMSGVQFGIFNLGGSRTAVMTTDANGIATSGLLKEGSYYVKELQTPSGYAENSRLYGIFDVKNNQVYSQTTENLSYTGTSVTGHPITNQKIYQIQVTKVDEKNIPVTSGNAVFALYETKAAAEEAVRDNDFTSALQTAETDEKGMASFDSITIKANETSQTYYLVESQAPENYERSGEIEEVTVTYDALNQTVALLFADKKYGKLKITKTADWNWGNPSEGTTDLSGAEFALYKAAGENEEPDENQEPAASLTTGADGTAASGYLEPGWYKIVETRAPEGFTVKSTPDWVEVPLNEGLNSPGEVTAQIQIKNAAVKGRFRVDKWDGEEVSGVDPRDNANGYTPLTGARFVLYKEAADSESTDLTYEGVNYHKVTGSGTEDFEVNGSYVSGMLEEGNYCIVETNAPSHTVNGVTVRFELDSTPHPFAVMAGTTVNLDVYNSARGTIELTKTGDQENGKEKITAAKFALFGTEEDASQERNAIDLNQAGITYTLTENVYKWTNVAPGTYWIKELASEELDALGYGINPDPIEVTLESGKKFAEAPLVEKTMEDKANKGRILVVKKDADTKASLTGAEFKLFVWDEEAQAETEVPGCTFTDQGDGTYLSSLVPAAKEGTAYILRETKAPEGYSLDPENRTPVTVYPLHKPEYVETADSNNNVAVLENKAQDQIASFLTQINKEIKNDGDADYAPSGQVRADESLQLADYTVDFKLSGYADGTNKVGAEKFIVTDGPETLIPYRAQNDTTTGQGDPAAYEAQTWKDGDYRINSVTLLPTSHGDGEQKITADIYVKTSVSGDEWTRRYENIELGGAEALEKSFAENEGVMGVRVSYNHVGEEFRSEGIVLNTTFLRRASDKDASEIRKITNQAQLYWEDLLLNEQGETASRTSGDLVSVQVTALIPAYSDKLPQVSIDNKVTTSQSLYYSGQTISYETTVTNHKPDEKDGADFKDPLVMVQMPAHTGLDQSFGTKGFSVRLAYEDENGATRYEKIDPDKYILTPITDTEAALGLGGAPGDYTTENGVLASSYVFDFKNLTLKPGQRILIGYQGFIDYESKTDINQLISPAYLSSTYTIPASKENPNGLSFAPYNQVLVTNPVTEEVDKTVDTSLEYLNAPTVSTVADLNQIAIEKIIGVEAPEGETSYEEYNGKKVKWLGKGETAHVNPTDEVFYKLIFRNYSDAPVTSAHIIDVLPYAGDHEVLPVGGRNGGYYISRGTTTPADAVMEVLSVSGGSNGSSTFYYTDYNWSEGSVDADCADNGVLGGIYSASGGWSGWTQGTSGKPTAIGAEVDFGAEGLATGGSYEITMAVKTPGFTADKVKDFYNKMMVNSAAVSVRRTGTAAGDLPPSDYTSSNKVMCTMDLPTGEIGDYVWYDTNENGVQDLGERAAAGIEVTLKKETHMSVGGTPYVQKESITTTTDAAGRYLFGNLYCNYVENPDITDPEDPDRYMGGEYYTYTVTFHKPSEDYGFTKQEVTGDGITKENDSNADENGNTAPIMLNVLEEDGKLYGERNLTIDAGLIQPYALGNRVWLDKNNNGIQDDGEIGVADVYVLLYQVVDGRVESTPFKTTKTDADGLYKFTNLQQGQYVVEFDTTALVKPDGTYQYDFTKALPSAGENDTDSDAEVGVDGQGQILNADGRILRTQVITLNDAALTEQGIRNKYDDRWDAGLVYYSALGGVAFDDTDYDDTHSQMRPLTGTKVELFLVNGGVREDQPIASTTVLEDGSYYFDHLVFDGETQEYAVKFTYPDGYRGVAQNVGDDTKDSDVNHFENDSRQEGFITSIILPKGEVSPHNDGGARKYAAIGDYVWNDTGKGNGDKDDKADRNGLQDDMEKPVPDVRVVLQYRDNAASEWKYYSETKTDANGKYLFKDLKSSPDIDTEYRVVFALPRDTVMTSLNTGTNSAIDSDANGTYQRNIVDAIEGSAAAGGFVTRNIKPGYGETDLTWDAGIVRLYSSVGDYVWYDDDNDGIQDPEEKPVPGIKVVLERSDTGASSGEWTAVGETVTDENGRYLFDRLLSGYYRVKFQLPEDYRATRYGQNGNDTASEYDSDAARRVAEGNWYYTRSFYLPDGKADMTWDAGIYKPVTRTVRKRVTRPTNRTVTRRVARKGADRTRVRTRNKTRNVKTGDNSSAGGWALVCISAMGAAYVLKKKKGTRVQQ